jgi:hypothetical protein
MKRLLGILLLAASMASGQCVMCYRTAAAQNEERSKVMNMGIFIMGVPPFLILGGFLLLCWRRSESYADQDLVEKPEDENRLAAAPSACEI